MKVSRRTFSKVIGKTGVAGLVLPSAILFSCEEDSEGNRALIISEVPNKALAGEPITLTWTSSPVNLLAIDFRIDSNRFIRLEEDYDANRGSFTYNLAPDTNGSSVQFRISDSATQEVLVETPKIPLVFVKRLLLADYAELTAIGGYRAFKQNVKSSFGVFRESEQTFKVLSLICPHAGCTPNYEEANEQFICPCHNSVFEQDGSFVSGPAGQALESLDYEFNNNELKVFLPG
jgi:Rieske Fe-S protein